MDSILNIQHKLNDCALINPFGEAYGFEDNKKRYKSTMAKLLYKEYGVYATSKPNVGFFVSSRGQDGLHEYIREIASGLGTDKFHLLYKGVNDPVLEIIHSEINEISGPVNGMGRWHLSLIAKKNWKEVDNE